MTEKEYCEFSRELTELCDKYFNPDKAIGSYVTDLFAEAKLSGTTLCGTPIAGEIKVSFTFFKPFSDQQFSDCKKLFNSKHPFRG